MEIESQSLVVITSKMNVLQIPIEDAYFSGSPRTDGFAQKKGFRYMPNTVDGAVES